MANTKLMEEHITVKEAAAALRISESSVYRYISEGYLAAMKLPGRKGSLLIMRKDFDSFISSCRERDNL